MANQFIEERIHDDIVRGTVGGPRFKTQIIRSGNGAEQRNIDWDEPLGRWELGERRFTVEQLNELQAFFRRVKGRATGFRFRDWGDYFTTHEEGDGVLLDQGGTLYLAKAYGDTVRRIRKPVAGTLSFKANGNPVVASVNAETGEVAYSGAPASFRWAGEFDVPVRFDVDELNYRLDLYDRANKQAMFYVNALPLIELRE